MATLYAPWFASSFLMRSNEDTIMAMLKKSFTGRHHIHPHQLRPWSSQVLPHEYAIGWWALNVMKQDRLLFPSILFQDHHIFRNNLSLEQNFLFSQLKRVLYMLAGNGSENTLVLANAQYRLSEGYIKTYILRIMDALFQLHERYISSSLVSQRPTEKVSANQVLARDLSQERMYYGIQLASIFRSFLCGKSRKFLFSPVHWISRYRVAPIVSSPTPVTCISILPYSSSSNTLLLILHHLLQGSEMERVKRAISDLIHLRGTKNRAKNHRQGDLESQPLTISGPIIESPALSLPRPLEHSLLIPRREREYNAAVETVELAPANDNGSPFKPIHPLQMCAPLVRFPYSLYNPSWF